MWMKSFSQCEGKHAKISCNGQDILVKLNIVSIAHVEEVLMFFDLFRHLREIPKVEVPDDSCGPPLLEETVKVYRNDRVVRSVSVH